MGFKSYFRGLRGFLLAILFTLGALNCQASANQCSDLFDAVKASPWIASLEKASPDAQKFWRDTGKKFQETLQKDLDHNIEIYKAAKSTQHPTIAFLQKLGFQFKDGRFLVPDFFFMMKNLDFMRQSADLPIELQFLWTLKHKQFGLEQSLALSPFQDFPAHSLVYNTKTSLLPNEAFGKLLASGVFPIGGLESASGTSRADFDRYQTKDPILSDFLHDLSHVQSLIENPDFAQAQKDAYKKREFRWTKLEKKLGSDSARNYRRRDEGTMAPFIFSESAWGFHSHYKASLEQMPALQKISAEQELLTGPVLRSRPPAEIEALKLDLQSLEKNWFKIVKAYGGASMDLITVAHPQFRDALYQFPMNAVQAALKNVNKRTSAWNEHDYNDAALVLRFLKEAPNFTPRSWEYFVVATDIKSSKVYESMRTIFKEHRGSEMSGFSALARFLGIRDTTQF